MTFETAKIIPAATSEQILPKNWQTTDDSISANDVIDAYFKGKADGAKEQFKRLRQEFLVNLKLASSISEELLSNANDNHIEVEEVFLKATNLNCFDVLLLLNESVFESTNALKKAYTLSRDIKQKYRSQRLHINFSFTENSEYLNKACLTSDGYLVRYGQKAEA